jgi:hypothetical protein
MTDERRREWRPFIIAVTLLGLAVAFPLIALVVVWVAG